VTLDLAHALVGAIVKRTTQVSVTVSSAVDSRQFQTIAIDVAAGVVV